MQNQNISVIIQKIKRAITRTAPDATIIFYESRNEVIDLVILLDQTEVTFTDRKFIADPIYDIEQDTGIRISPVIKSKNEWESRQRMAS